MKSKTPFILIAVLILCVAFVLVRYTDLFRGPPQQPAETVDRVFETAPGRVTRITIQPAGGEAVTLSGEDPGAIREWRIVEPIDARADEWKAGDVASLLEGIDDRLARSFGPEDTPDTNITGLDEPRWTLRFKDADGRSYSLRIGRPEVLSGGDRRYVQPGESDRVYVVEADFERLLENPLRNLRDKDIIDIDQRRITRVEVDGRDRYELVRDGDDWRVLAEGFSAPALKEPVRKLIQLFSPLAVEAFITDHPESLSSYGLDEPRATVRLHLGAVQLPAATTTPATEPAEETCTLLLGNTTREGAYAKLERSDSVFRLRASAFEDFQPTLAEVREKTLVRFETDRVVAIEMDLPTGSLRLERQDGAWRMLAPETGPASGAVVSRLLDDLAALQAERFVDAATPAAYGLQPPRASITLRPDKGDPLTLRIGARSPSGKVAFAQTAGDQSVAVVDGEEAAALLREPAGYYSPRLLELPAGAKVVGVTLERPDFTYVLVRRDGAWRLTEPLDAAADQARVNALLRELDPLTANSVVRLGGEIPNRYKTTVRHVTVHLTLEGEPATAATTTPATGPATLTRTIHVAGLDDKAYAWVESDGLQPIGAMSARFFDDLLAEYRDRNLTSVQPQDVQEVRIATRDEAIELRREGDGWACVEPDPYVQIDPDKVEKMLRGVDDLTAKRFVAHGDPRPGLYGLDDPWLTVTLTRAEAEPVAIVVSGKGAEGAKNRYATMTGVKGVFLLSAEDAAALAHDLEHFTK
jgi:hypothetical protein